MIFVLILVNNTRLVDKQLLWAFSRILPHLSPSSILSMHVILHRVCLQSSPEVAQLPFTWIQAPRARTLNLILHQMSTS